MYSNIILGKYYLFSPIYKIESNKLSILVTLLIIFISIFINIDFMFDWINLNYYIKKTRAYISTHDRGEYLNEYVTLNGIKIFYKNI